MLDDSDELLASECVRQNLERTLDTALLDAIIDAGSRDVRVSTHHAGRYRCFRVAREFIEAHAGEPIYVDDLAAAAGLTGRGLEEAFHDLLGISPTASLRNRRLHGTRHSLRCLAFGSGVVKRVALERGFWHLGHFAHEYGALFGESPCETLMSHCI